MLQKGLDDCELGNSAWILSVAHFLAEWKALHGEYWDCGSRIWQARTRCRTGAGMTVLGWMTRCMAKVLAAISLFFPYQLALQVLHFSVPDLLCKKCWWATILVQADLYGRMEALMMENGGRTRPMGQVFTVPRSNPQSWLLVAVIGNVVHCWSESETLNWECSRHLAHCRKCLGFCISLVEIRIFRKKYPKWWIQLRRRMGQRQETWKRCVRSHHWLPVASLHSSWSNQNYDNMACYDVVQNGVRLPELKGMRLCGNLQIQHKNDVLKACCLWLWSTCGLLVDQAILFITLPMPFAVSHAPFEPSRTFPLTKLLWTSHQFLHYTPLQFENQIPVEIQAILFITYMVCDWFLIFELQGSIVKELERGSPEFLWRDKSWLAQRERGLTAKGIGTLWRSSAQCPRGKYVMMAVSLHFAKRYCRIACPCLKNLNFGREWWLALALRFVKMVHSIVADHFVGRFSKSTAILMYSSIKSRWPENKESHKLSLPKKDRTSSLYQKILSNKRPESLVCVLPLP